MSSVIGKFINVWLHPWSTMNSIREEGEEAGIKSSMVFIIIMGVLSGLLTAIMSMIFPPQAVPGVPAGVTWLAVLIVPLVSFLGSFVGAFILWGLIFGLLKGSMPQYKMTYRLLAVLAAFSPVSAILSPIPTAGQWLAILINIWVTIVMIRGIIIVAAAPPVRTWVICGILFSLLFILGLTARFAAQQQLAGGVPGIGTGADTEFDFDEEALNRELEELANQAEEAPEENQ